MNNCLLVVVGTGWRPSSRGAGGGGLATKRQAQERQTKEHLAMNGKGRDEDPKPHLGYHPEAGLEQKGAEDL